MNHTRVPADAHKAIHRHPPTPPHDPDFEGRRRSEMLADLAAGRLPRLELGYRTVGNNPLERVYEGGIPQPLELTLADACPVAHDVRYLYVLTGPAGFIYVGQTRRPAGRILAHRKKSQFWRHVTGMSIFRHQYAGIWPSADREIVEIERGIITDLMPIYNLDRTLAEWDKGAPWESELHRFDRAASAHALYLLERSA